jgi:uracil-DNA glycosylase family 4
MPISAKESLKELSEEIIQCKKCLDLVKLRKQPVAGTGASNARVILVRNYPEETDEKTDILSANNLLRKLIKKINLSLSKDVYITYLVKCTPKKNPASDAERKTATAKPSKKHINNCISFFSKEISIITPHIVIPLGLDASNIILGKYFSVDKKYRSMDKIHMRIFENPSFKLVPFYEPEDVVLSKKIPEDKYTEDFKNLHRLLKVI